MSFFTKLQEYKKARAERKKAEIDLVETVERKDRREEDKQIEVYVKDIFPYVMNRVAKIIQETHGQREMNLSHLRQFFIEHFDNDFTKVNEEALQICWEKIQELDGVSYDKERNIYILRRW